MKRKIMVLLIMICFFLFSCYGPDGIPESDLISYDFVAKFKVNNKCVLLVCKTIEHDGHQWYIVKSYETYETYPQAWNDACSNAVMDSRNLLRKISLDAERGDIK